MTEPVPDDGEVWDAGRDTILTMLYLYVSAVEKNKHVESTMGHSPGFE
jgi:hypothetical protein